MAFDSTLPSNVVNYNYLELKSKRYFIIIIVTGQWYNTIILYIYYAYCYNSKNTYIKKKFNTAKHSFAI